MSRVEFTRFFKTIIFILLVFLLVFYSYFCLKSARISLVFSKKWARMKNWTHCSRTQIFKKWGLATINAIKDGDRSWWLLTTKPLFTGCFFNPPTKNGVFWLIYLNLPWFTSIYHNLPQLTSFFIFDHFFMVSELLSKKFAIKIKSRNQSQKRWVPKKIGAEKCFWIGLKKFGIEKRLWIGKLKILGLVTHWTTDALLLKVYLIRDSSHLFDILAPYWVPIYFSGSLFAMFWLDSHKKNFPLGPYWVPIS